MRAKQSIFVVLLAVALAGPFAVSEASAPNAWEAFWSAGGTEAYKMSHEKDIDDVRQHKSTCPSLNPEDEAYVRDFVEEVLTSSSLANARQVLGLDGISVSQVQLLKDATDQAVCQQLDVYFDDPGLQYQPIYYKAGGFYFVVGWFEQPYIGYSPVFVFDGGVEVDDLKQVFSL